MATGACGINCHVCRLNLIGICSTCGSGTSREGAVKMAAQTRLLGAPCPILNCAVHRGVAYCPKDCDRFPCDAFRSGPYPFSSGYLDMQERRRQASGEFSYGGGVRVPTQYWEDLSGRDMEGLCRNALVTDYPPRGLILPFLGRNLLIDRQNRCLHELSRSQWARMNEPLLTLLCLVYLLNVGPEPLKATLVGVQELKTGHFFHGPHELQVQPLLGRYGNDLKGFEEAAERLGGEALDLADVAYRLLPFPKIPIYYLLWEGDEEFEPRLSILFDGSVEDHLSADAIWGLTNLVSNTLLAGGRGGEERSGPGR